MVLGEPADVDPAARQRMYAIPNEAKSSKQLPAPGSHLATDLAPRAMDGALALAGAATTSAATARVDQSLALEVPDYLRASAWSRYRIMLMALAAALLVGASLLLVPGLRGLFGGKATSDLSAANGEVIDVPAAGVPGAGDLGLAGDAARADTPTTGGRYGETPGTAVPPGAASDQLAAGSQTGGAEIGLGQAAVTPDALRPSTTAPTPGGIAGAGPNDGIAGTGSGMLPSRGTPDVPVSARPDIVPLPGDVPLPDWPVTVSGDRGLPAGAMPAEADTRVAALPGDAANVTQPPGSIAAAAGAATPGAAATGDAAAGQAVPVPALATFPGGKTILLRYQDDERAWFRSEPRAAFRAGDRLLALPEFRPKIAFASGIDLTMSGGTLVTIGTADTVAGVGLPAGDASVPAIEIVYGRVVLVNTAGGEKLARLVLGPTAADVRLARNAKLAIEVQRKYVPGRDPRRTPASVVVQLFAPDGNVQWQDASGQRQVEQPAQWTIAEGSATEPAAIATLPGWIEHEPNARSSEQLYGAPVIEAALTPTRAADQQLLEVYLDSQKREVRSLAAKCSIHVGLFVPFVDALSDSGQRPNWRAHIDDLRSAMALSSESAEMVWQALVQQRGERAAADLYEMLCGYDLGQIGRTREQVKNGAAAQLIKWLESDRLDYRVLAVENLWEIYGKRLMANPDGTPIERVPGIRDWNRRLDAGELVPVEGR
jgi:hypothetical protein